MLSDVKFPRWAPRALRPAPEVLTRARQFAIERFKGRFDQAMEIPGWLHPDQASMLCYLADQCPAGPIVEIGSFKGKSTVFLATGAKPDATVFAVDPHILTLMGSRQDRAKAEADGVENTGSSWERFQQTLTEWGAIDRVSPIREFSYDARKNWNDPIALLWIDGDHSYDGVKQDIDDWAPLVVKNGYIAFHDTRPKGDHIGVRRAIVSSGLLDHLGFETVVELRNAWFLKRTRGGVESQS
jgi:Methyltransferase domain